jgi:hypothetical protein
MRIFKVRPKARKNKVFILIPKKSEGRLPEHPTAGTGRSTAVGISHRKNALPAAKPCRHQT